MAEDSAYSWYDGQPNTSIANTNASKPDQRALPMNYPQAGGGRDLSTGCRVDGDYGECKYGVKSSRFNRCTYFRFSMLCDKVLDKDGKELN